jgi:hypothetical protein
MDERRYDYGCVYCPLPSLHFKSGEAMKKYYILGALFLAAFLALVAYGLETDCPDTAIYYYCGD